ncbi:MAG: adenylate/guanylate cyclase domain-containing protein [Pseudomonadota bacterium]
MNSGETQYTRSGDINIAYQVHGDGPLDIVYVPGWVSHVELAWEEPLLAQFLSRLASFSRLIMFDKRGTGLSDRLPNSQLPKHDDRMDDIRAVMDAVGSERAAFIGHSEGGGICALFAATYPERTSALVLWGTFAKRVWSSDYPWAPKPENREAEYEHIEREWGNEMDLSRYVPSKMCDKDFVRRVATYLRRSASPGAAVTLLKMNTQLDITGVLPSIHVPTLIMHRTGDLDVNVAEGRWLAERIEGARFIEFPGDDHLPWVGDMDVILDATQEFLTGTLPEPDVTRVLATILFTDIVQSTQHLHEQGDRAWKDLLERHDILCRRCLERFRGRLIKSTGDGIHATFDGPGRAIACARAIQDGAAGFGVGIRAGLHTGECEIRGDETEGIAVHLAARVAGLAEAGEVLVSRTVRDLVVGSELKFNDRGLHELRGFPEAWQIFAVN